jgi:hypothetical protein
MVTVGTEAPPTYYGSGVAAMQYDPGAPFCLASTSAAFPAECRY